MIAADAQGWVGTVASAAPAVRLSGIVKRYGALTAVQGVDLEIEAGSIHGLIGENGAGKSSLMGVLYGLHAPDAGRIELHGRRLQPGSTPAAIAAGLGMVHQHFMLVDRFTVLENIVLGAEGGWRLGPGLARARRAVAALAETHGLAVEFDAPVRDLPVGVLQRVEILKALYRGAKVLILDEPSGVLTPAEVEQLLRLLRSLRAAGTTVLLISHKLDEVLAVCDRVSVMRAGRIVAEREAGATDAAELARLMVGREVATLAAGTPRTPSPGAPEAVLDAASLSWRDARGVLRLADVHLRLHAGEIVGLAGVAGNGQSELLGLLAGLLPLQQGRLSLTAEGGERPRHFDAHHRADPRTLRRLGLAHIPEDRHRHGLVLDFAAWESAVLGHEDDPALARGPAWTGLLHGGRMRRRCAALMQALDVRPRQVDRRCAQFSGGNQQKLVVAREIEHEPRVLLVGQPTRGVDVGAIETLHRALLRRRDAGCALLLVSTELDEILALSDRVLVMSQGRITGEFTRAEADRGRIGLCMGQAGESSAFASTFGASAGAADGAVSGWGRSADLPPPLTSPGRPGGPP